MSGESTEFPVVMRGYERGPVDDAIRDLNKDLMHLSAQNAQLAQELKEAKASREAVDALLSEVETPSYSGVGAKAALILSTAEDQAQDLIRTAKGEAASLRKKLQDEIQALHGEAKGYYDSLVAEAQRRADRESAAARIDYDDILNHARKHSALNYD